MSVRTWIVGCMLCSYACGAPPVRPPAPGATPIPSLSARDASMLEPPPDEPEPRPPQVQQEVQQELERRGYALETRYEDRALAEGEASRVEVALEQGTCYAFVAVGAPGLQDVDLLVHDASHVLVDRDVEQDATAIVRLCPETSASFEITVRAYAGSGAYALQLYRWQRGVEGPFGLSGLLWVRLAEMTAMLEDEGYAPRADSPPIVGRFDVEGEAHRHTVELAAGTCAALVAVGGKGINDLDLQLERGKRRIARDETRHAFPVLRHCLEKSTSHALTVRAINGVGRYVYQIFERPRSDAAAEPPP